MSDFCELLVLTDRAGKSTGDKHSLLLWLEKSLSESAQLNKEKGILQTESKDSVEACEELICYD